MENTIKIDAKILFALYRESDGMTLCDLLTVLYSEKIPMTEAVEKLGIACQAF